MMKVATLGIVAGIVAIFVAVAVLVGVYFFVYKKVVQTGKVGSAANSAVGIYKNAKQAAADEKRLYATGRDAEAIILEVHDTGFATKRYTQLALVLEVMSADGKTFQVNTKKMISQSHAFLFQPGAKLKVKYDPSHPGKVALVSSPIPASTEKKDVAHRLEELNSLQKKGLIGKDEYRKKRQEILKNL